LSSFLSGLCPAADCAKSRPAARDAATNPALPMKFRRYMENLLSFCECSRAVRLCDLCSEQGDATSSFHHDGLALLKLAKLDQRIPSRERRARSRVSLFSPSDIMEVSCYLSCAALVLSARDCELGGEVAIGVQRAAEDPGQTFEIAVLRGHTVGDKAFGHEAHLISHPLRHEGR
jgi:hypothetical protein